MKYNRKYSTKERIRPNPWCSLLLPWEIPSRWSLAYDDWYKTQQQIAKKEMELGIFSYLDYPDNMREKLRLYNVAP